MGRPPAAVRTCVITSPPADTSFAHARRFPSSSGFSCLSRSSPAPSFASLNHPPTQLFPVFSVSLFRFYFLMCRAVLCRLRFLLRSNRYFLLSLSLASTVVSSVRCFYPPLIPVLSKPLSARPLVPSLTRLVPPCSFPSVRVVHIPSRLASHFRARNTHPLIPSPPRTMPGAEKGVFLTWTR